MLALPYKLLYLFGKDTTSRSPREVVVGILQTQGPWNSALLSIIIPS